ncbi:MAG TPA: GNAT family N-acetyltransferase, partial [Usitatibacter sp.]|nr:GNAT family N-acetyltransferase [Usitatibacter sp.]
MARRMQAHIENHGWGLWAVETREAREFVGLVGLAPVKDAMPFAPAVEVGWRLARGHWHRGYATEAARAALDFAFEKLALDGIVSFTAQANRASQAVMERLGMRRTEAFEHPAIDPASALRRHWLYRLARTEWFRPHEVTAGDLPALQRFLEDNPGYFRAVHGEPPSAHEAREAFEQLPPAGWPYTRKWLLAFRSPAGSIAAVADVIEDLFSDGVWHIGFFMAETALHGSGIPRTLYTQLEDWTRARGARWLRLGVVRDNGRAQRFWEKMGYVEVAERQGYVVGRRTHVLRVMAKPLAGGKLEEYRALVPRDSPVPAPTP